MTIREVGPRDGLQMAKSVMTTDAKIVWIAALVKAGLREIEVGSFVPPRLLPQMADSADVVKAATGRPGLCVVALAPNLKGAQRAAEAGAHVVSVPVSVSEEHSQANTRRSTAEALEEVRRMAQWLKTTAPQLRLEVGCSTAFGCSLVGEVPERKVVEVATTAIEFGAHSVVLADTVGYANPAAIRRRVNAVRAAIGSRLTGLHLHDTLGMGLANAAAGLEVGVRHFDGSLAGLGGCPYAPGASGNVTTEDLVFMLEEMGFDTGIDLELLLEARGYLQRNLADEQLHGSLARAGFPKTWRQVRGLRSRQANPSRP
ncbi:MAG: hydroxymethylglutaryl-CoA lyase [Dongiaceae bacterium]